MTPGSPCYLDHYQGNPYNEPLAFGGNNTLSKVYSFNPIAQELPKQQHKYILGAQGNVWTEYIVRNMLSIWHIPGQLPWQKLTGHPRKLGNSNIS